MGGHYKKSKRDAKKKRARSDETHTTTIQIIAVHPKNKKKLNDLAPPSHHGNDHYMNELIYSKAANLFAQYDVDNSKTLGETELRQILVILGCEAKLGAKKFDDLMKHSFSKFDKDGNAELDFQEFLRLYSMLMGHYKKSKNNVKKPQAWNPDGTLPKM